MATQYKPILFSTEMVLAILEGRKTQTRRLHGLDEIKKNPNDWTFNNFSTDDKRTFAHFRKKEDNKIKSIFGTSPYQIGDILWVRETWQTTYNEGENKWDTIYKADGFFWIDDDGPMKWKPSIYMPKKRARIFLEVTNVRVERLQDISEEDAIAEGVESFNHGYGGSPVGVWYKDYIYGKFNLKPNFSFKSLWKKINGEDSWKSNPWVWVYEFKQVHHPKGFLNED